MRILANHQRARRAFTLTEIMITMALMMIVMAGVIYGHVAGLKMYGLTRAKLGASDMARAAINNLVTEIRSAKRVRVGNGTATSFAGLAEGEAQRGNALLINATLNTNQWVRYYVDPASTRLIRMDHSGASREIVAEFVSNQVVFAAEDYQGNVLTNYYNNRVVSLTLRFYQMQYPVTAIGTPGAYFDFYQLRTRVTRRTLE